MALTKQDFEKIEASVTAIVDVAVTRLEQRLDEKLSVQDEKTQKGFKALDGKTQASIDVAVIRLERKLDVKFIPLEEKVQGVIVEVRSLRQELESMKQMMIEDAAVDNERMDEFESRLVLLEKRIGIAV